MKHGLLVAGGSWQFDPPVAIDYLQEFFNNRRGFGRTVTAGIDSSYTVLTVTTTADSGAGSFRAACLVTGKTIIRFDPTLGDISSAINNKSSWTPTSDTLIDGYGYTGTLYGSIIASNVSNVVIMYLSVTQPFRYGGTASGPCIGMSNCAGGYVYRCTLWDSGDVLMTGGAYQLTPNHLTDRPAPYFYTVDQCRLGPNPGNYAVMATPVGTTWTSRGAWTAGVAYAKGSTVTQGGWTWYAQAAVAANTVFAPGDWVNPGFLNGINNDARNGKCMECAYDHGWVDGSGRKLAGVTFTSTTAFTVGPGTLDNPATSGRTMILGAGIPRGSDGEGSSFTYIDATHGTLDTATYTGTVGSTITDAQTYQPSSVPHPDDFADFDHATYVTMVDNVLQGCMARNGKSRSEYVHVASSIVAKYGAPYSLGGNVVYGQGSNIEDNATAIHEGIVFIPYNAPTGGVEEQFLGFMDVVADANGVPHIHATDPAAKTFALNGTAPQAGNDLFRKNWVPAGATVDVAPFTTGFDTSTPPGVHGAGVPGYTLTVPDMSVLANAKALVARLEDDDKLRAGNPFSTTQPPSWRAVHTGATFPPPNITPPTKRALFGAYMATHTGTGETYAQANARGDTAMGPLQVIRVYDNNAGAPAVKTAASNMGVLGVRPCILSFKYTPTSVTAGTYDAALRSFFTGLPASVYWCFDHEMDSKIQQGQYTTAQWLAAWRYIYALSKTTTSAAKATPIWTGYNFTVSTTTFPSGRFAALYPGNGYVDVIGVDPYTTTTGQTASQIIAPLLSAVASTGKPLGVAETATDYATPSTSATAAFVSSWGSVASQLEFVSWFNGTGPGIRDNTQTIDYQIDGVTATASAYQAVVTG